MVNHGYVYSVLILLALRFIKPDLLITGVVHEYWGYSTVGTPIYSLFMLYLLLYSSIAVYWAYRTSLQMQGDLKQQVRYIGLGILFSIILALITQVSRPLLHLPLPELTVASTIVFISIIAYAVSKYGLLTITTRMIAENIIATMDDYVLAFDSKFNLALINQSATRKLGVTQEESLGKPIKQFISSNLIDLSNTEFISKFPIIGEQAYLVSKTSERIPVSL